MEIYEKSLRILEELFARDGLGFKVDFKVHRADEFDIVLIE